MPTRTDRDVTDIVRVSRTTDAAPLAEAAYARLLGLLERLDADEWAMPTECDGWDVAAMVGHLIGAGKACASLRELLRQQRWGLRHRAAFDGNGLDAANHLQVVDHAPLDPPGRLAALRAVAPEAVRGRMRLPRPLRALRVPLDAGGSTASGMPRTLGIGALMDVVYTRDVWLHTVDIARATGRGHVADAHVDGRVVEDVVAEWARRHGALVTLDLTGAAGGRYHQGERGPRLQMDAVDFCRVLSGRAAPEEAVDDRSDARAVALLETRVVF